MKRDYSPATLACAALLFSSCGSFGYDLNQIFDSPAYQTITARTAVLPPMPAVGVGAGELDSARVTFTADGDTDETFTTWTYADDLVSVAEESSSFSEDDGTTIEVSYDLRFDIPTAVDDDGDTVTEIFSRDEDTGEVEQTGTRTTTRVGGRVTTVVDVSFEEDGSLTETQRNAYTYTADGRLATEVVLVDFATDGLTAFSYDSSRYTYSGDDITFERFGSGDPDEEIALLGTGTANPGGGTFTLSVTDDEDDTFSYSFTDADGDFVLEDDTFTRTDDGTDATYREYTLTEGGEDGFTQTYQYYYRSLLSPTRQLPALATTLTAPNPIAAGQAIALGELPAGATFQLTDALGRSVQTGPATSRQTLTFPAVPAGTYVLTLNAPDYRAQSWRLLAR